VTIPLFGISNYHKWTTACTKCTLQEEAGSLVDAGGVAIAMLLLVDIAKMLKIHYCSTLACYATLVGRCNKSLV